MSSDRRAQALHSWACEAMTAMMGETPAATELSMVSGDASFRRYFRLTTSGTFPLLPGETRPAVSHLLVDAPPDKEDNPRFVRIAGLLRSHGLRTPRVHARDYDQGFLLLEDFGDELLLPALDSARARSDEAGVDDLYSAALRALLDIQAIPADTAALPPYDRSLLQREMRLFDWWFCTRLLGWTLTEEEHDLVSRTYAFLEDEVLAHAQVVVHRDYHSRNLMLLSGAPQEAPGIIDFQDAVIGSWLYDPVSLLRDCYIVWPPERVEAWLQAFASQARERGIVDARAAESAQRDFDLMGLQRHLKVIGIFARLSLRDGKDRYLADIPVALDYVMQVLPRQPELHDFHAWFRDRVLPAARDTLPERST